MSRLACILATVALPIYGNAQESERSADVTLATNPFDRPSFVLNLDESTTTGQMRVPLRLELRTTVVGADSALANINGQVVTVGETLDGYRVAAIREGRVILTKDGERIELDIYAQQRGEEEGRDEVQR